MESFLPPLKPKQKSAYDASIRTLGAPQPCAQPGYRSHSLASLALTIVGVIGIGGVGVLLAISLTSAAPPEVVVYHETTEPRSLAYGSQPLLSYPPFYKSIQQAFVAERKKFIEADLSVMQLRLYDEGVVIFEAPIVSKGRKGTWWETPAGLYAVEYKSKSHYSSFGQVFQPWSMVFQGNFFIHGWPHYADGTLVPEGYSGGCIRLSNDDAEALYALVKTGTPVLVYESNTQTESVATPPLPEVDAAAFLIADLDSATILTRSGPDVAISATPFTKLMTALVAADYVNFDRTLTISESMLATTSIPRLVSGTTMTTYSLLYPLLLEASNESAEALAHGIGKKRFVTLMNSKAEALGMRHTTFVDVTGLDEGNRSTVEDLLRLLVYTYENRRAVLGMTAGERDMTSYVVYPFEDLQNLNTITGLDDFVGGVIGEHASGVRSALLVYMMQLYGKERAVAFIVHDTPDVENAVRALHRYVDTFYGMDMPDAPEIPPA